MFEISLFAVLLIIYGLISVQGERIDDDYMVDPEPIDDCIQWINTIWENATFNTDQLAYMDVCFMFVIILNGPYY